MTQQQAPYLQAPYLNEQQAIERVAENRRRGILSCYVNGIFPYDGDEIFDNTAVIEYLRRYSDVHKSPNGQDYIVFEEGGRYYAFQPDNPRDIVSQHISKEGEAAVAPQEVLKILLAQKGRSTPSQQAKQVVMKYLWTVYDVRALNVARAALYEKYVETGEYKDVAFIAAVNTDDSRACWEKYKMAELGKEYVPNAKDFSDRLGRVMFFPVNAVIELPDVDPPDYKYSPTSQTEATPKRQLKALDVDALLKIRGYYTAGGSGIRQIIGAELPRLCTMSVSRDFRVQVQDNMGKSGANNPRPKVSDETRDQVKGVGKKGGRQDR